MGERAAAVTGLYLTCSLVCDRNSSETQCESGGRLKVSRIGERGTAHCGVVLRRYCQGQYIIPKMHWGNSWISNDCGIICFTEQESHVNEHHALRHT